MDDSPAGLSVMVRHEVEPAIEIDLEPVDSVVVTTLIDNAEAVEPGPAQPAGTGGEHFAGAVAGLGAAEAQRRRLTEADVAAIVHAEAAEREAAAREYERGGHADEAARLRHGTRGLLAAVDGEADA